MDITALRDSIEATMSQQIIVQQGEEKEIYKEPEKKDDETGDIIAENLGEGIIRQGGNY